MSTDTIRLVLHALAGVLIWPVLLALLGLAASTLVLLGAFAREAWDRRRGVRRAVAACAHDLERVDHGPAPLPVDVRLEGVLQQHEHVRWRAVRRARMAVRVGPALGLMGTLIPMADALQGLADGNLPALASNMVTAFAATVIGLTISVVAYIVTTVQEDWVRSDLQSMALLAEEALEARQRRRTPAEVA